MDFKVFRNMFVACLIGLMVAISGNIARAVIIEGFTEAGNFKTVQVSEDGRLLISVATGVAQAVFFISSQPVISFQGTSPWIVEQSSPITLSDVITTKVSSATTINQAQISVTGVATSILPIEVTRNASLVCNQSTLTAFIGNSGVTPSNGTLLAPGSCFSPDNPISFIGELFAISTGPTLTISNFRISP